MAPVLDTLLPSDSLTPIYFYITTVSSAIVCMHVPPLVLTEDCV